MGRAALSAGLGLVLAGLAAGSPAWADRHDDDRPPAAATQASGTGASGTGASGTGASGTGASGTGASGTGASGTSATDVAFANPRVAPLADPSAPALLPRPLDATQAERIAHVMALRARGRLTAANQEAAGLEDSPLQGHLLADLYLARGARPDADALRAWLVQYSDHPEAPAIYDLLLARPPRAGPPRAGAAAAPLPPAPSVRALGRDGEYAPPADPPDGGDAGKSPSFSRRPALEQALDHRVDSGDGAGAMTLIAQTKGLEPVYAGQLRGRVIQRLFLRGGDDAATTLAAGLLPAGFFPSGDLAPSAPAPGAPAPGAPAPGASFPPVDAASSAPSPNFPSEGMIRAAAFSPGAAHGGLPQSALSRGALSRGALSGGALSGGALSRSALSESAPALDAISSKAFGPPAPGAEIAAQLPPEAAPAIMPEGAGLAAFAGGLSAWRSGRIVAAAALFEAAWATPGTRRDLRTAGAFWAARAHMRLGAGPYYLVWMRRAAAHPLDFYGMIARRSLAMDDGFSPPPRRGAPTPVDRRARSRGSKGGDPGLSGPTIGRAGANMVLGEADVAAVDATPAGHRAFALLQIGHPERAEAEFRCLWEQAADDPDLRRSLLLTTRRAGLAAAAAQMAAAMPKDGAQPGPKDGAQAGGGENDGPYPAPALLPLNGYMVPPPLVYGVTLQESSFDPGSVSSTGARGLMQLMPMTAVEVAGDPALAGADIERLHDPMLNLDLGQRYLLELGRMPALEGDLIRILASYYSGPAAVSRWAPDLLVRDAASRPADGAGGLGSNANGSNANGPNVIGPNVTRPNVTRPNVTGPNVIGPNVIGPNVIGPNVIGPNVTRPKMTGPSGPGVNMAGADPLLFLESIPAEDVRDYARRGLKYSWIYAARFHMPAPGLDDLAAGRFPRFSPLPTARTFLPPHLRP